MDSMNVIGALFERSVSSYLGSIVVNKVSVTCTVNDETACLVFSAPIYSSTQLSEAIRQQASVEVVLGAGLPRATASIVDEEQAVYLSFEEPLDQLNYARFTELLDEFSWLSKEWADLFDEEPFSELTFAYINKF
ncbi:MAG: hypothetical protein ACI9S8_001139 [Chlamydiales bacterium]|jgi:hypothetical protein